MKKTLIFILCTICSAAYSGQPYDYTINTPNPADTAFRGFQQGVLIGQQVQNARQQRELRQAQIDQINREQEYKRELRKLYDEPALLSNESLMKLMILYPEFNDTTLKIKELFDKMKSE